MMQKDVREERTHDPALPGTVRTSSSLTFGRRAFGAGHARPVRSFGGRFQPALDVEELRARESLCPHRIRPVRRSLQNQRDDLLAFLNHHRFMRSERDERVGKSPAELLTGEKQPHWIELLSFEMFRRN